MILEARKFKSVGQASDAGCWCVSNGLVLGHSMCRLCKCYLYLPLKQDNL